MKCRCTWTASLILALLLSPAAMAQEPTLEDLRLQLHEMKTRFHANHRMQEIDMLGKPGPDQVSEELQEIRRHLFELDVEQARLEARRDAVVKRIEENEARGEGEGPVQERLAQVPEQIGQVFDEFIASLGPLEGKLGTGHIEGLHGYLEVVRDDIAEHIEEVIGALEEHHEQAARMEDMRHWLVETEIELAEITAQRNVLREREGELAGRMEEVRSMLRARVEEEQALEKLELQIHAREMEDEAQKENPAE